MLTRKLGRKRPHRLHMLRNLAASVILEERVYTTEAKAKEVKKMIESSITTAKKKTVAARRQLTGLYFQTAVVDKLMDSLADRYATRSSGYTRALRIGVRKGDSADQFMVALIAAEKATVESVAKSTLKNEVKKPPKPSAEVTKPAEAAEVKDA